MNINGDKVRQKKVNVESLNDSLSAVSLIVKLIFLTIITVLLFSTLYLWTNPNIPDDKSTPQYELECYYSDDGDYIIEIQGIIKGEKTPLSFVWYELEGSGYNSRWGQKNASRTIGTDLEFEHWNFSYVDRDNDGYATEGDYFIIRSRDNGGPARDGMTIRMIFTISFDFFAYLDLTSETKKDFEYPSTRWGINNLNETNISMDKNQSALSHHTISENDMQKCRLSFKNTGNESLNLKIIIRNESDNIKEHHILLNKSTEAIVNASFQANFSNSTTAMKEIHSVNIVVIDENTTEVLLSVHTDYQVNRYASASDSFSMEPILIIFSTFFIVCLIINMNRAIPFGKSRKSIE